MNGQGPGRDRLKCVTAGQERHLHSGATSKPAAVQRDPAAHVAMRLTRGPLGRQSELKTLEIQWGDGADE